LQKDKTNILVFVTHSLGELDVLFPLFARLREERSVSINLVFTVKRIYEQFRKNEFYNFCATTLAIDICKRQLTNKFDYRDTYLAQNRFGSRLLKFYFSVITLINIPRITPKLLRADIYMHEYSNQRHSTFILYLFQKYFEKHVFTYIHGQSFNQVPKYPRLIAQADKSTLLLWHPNNFPLVSSLGYTKTHLIGMTKFYNEWAEVINLYCRSTHINIKTVVIYTRDPDHKYYMSKEIYEELLISSHRVVRKRLPDIKIIIKPHPRENSQFVNDLISHHRLDNTIISHEHSAVLANNALFTISFWTSCLFDSLSRKVPAVEYFKEPRFFREIEPQGSMYRKLGIDSVDNEPDLLEFVDAVLSNKYTIPKIILNLETANNIDFF
jgi:hypothetical protein